MTDVEILRKVGLGTMLDNMDHNLIGRWVLKAMEQAREDERARLEREKAELVEALQTIVDLDDGDTPGLWYFEKEFDEARDVLAALAKEAKHG